nr:hypothetical protein [Acinetobacter ursingii]
MNKNTKTAPNIFNTLIILGKFNLPNVGDKITVNITTEAEAAKK